MLWTESWRWRANSCNIFGFRLQRLYPAFLLINGLQKQILIFFSSFWVTVKERLQKAESLRSVAPFKINKFRKLSLSEEEKKSPLNQLGLFFIFFPASCSCEKIEERGRLIQTLANINNKLPPFLPLWRKKWDNPCVNHSGQSAFRLTVNWQTQDKSCTIFFMDFCCFVCFFASRVMNYVRVKKSQIQINISSWQDPPFFFVVVWWKGSQKRIQHRRSERFVQADWQFCCLGSGCDLRHDKKKVNCVGKAFWVELGAEWCVQSDAEVNTNNTGDKTPAVPLSPPFYQHSTTSPPCFYLSGSLLQVSALGCKIFYLISVDFSRKYAQTTSAPFTADGIYAKQSPE